MKNVTIQYYTAAELKEKFPGGFERALNHYRELVSRGDADILGDEILGSIKGAFNAAGVKMGRYELGAYSRSYIDVARFPNEYDGYDDPGALSGPRAMAWIENNLLGPLRVPYISIQEARAARAEESAYYEAVRAAGGRNTPEGRAIPDPRRYTRRRAARLYNAPGAVPSCPFTELYYDDGVIDAIVKEVKTGGTLSQAFEGLADFYRDTLEKEIEWRSEEAQFLETAAANDWYYTEDGEME